MGARDHENLGEGDDVNEGREGEKKEGIMEGEENPREKDVRALFVERE
ncbi:hypothetical protein COLO4_20827 [Corchorus olitorius]|uniref:Uncharacterized protein n=1 Tax=Corchorus olitorius TaxID=93759 RepID=A0A1R3IWQ0_9ROSI|nr:hypothetical protein COLO4_20827 [Corchorus olitorius]